MCCAWGGGINVLEKFLLFVEIGGENILKGQNKEQMHLCFYYCLMSFFPKMLIFM